MADDTEHLAIGARSGSEDDFAALYDRVSPALIAWARIRIAGPMQRFADPEDIVQEVWWRAVERFGVFDSSRGSFRTWLFGIASNVLRELVRKRTGLVGSVRAQREAMVETLPTDLKAQWTSISVRVRRAEDSQRISEFIARLDDDEKSLFVHRGLEGLDTDDVAVILGISENAVRKRWSKLQQKLEPHSLWRDLVGND